MSLGEAGVMATLEIVKAPTMVMMVFLKSL
jgi:hypothetical protein